MSSSDLTQLQSIVNAAAIAAVELVSAQDVMEIHLKAATTQQVGRAWAYVF